MSRPRETLAAVITALAITWHLLAVLAPAWTTVGAKPARGRDFATYYYAVQVAAEGGDPYTRGELGKTAREDGIRAGVHPFLYPPPFLLLMAWSLPLDLLTAYRVWFWLDELWMAVAMFALWRWWRPLGSAVGPLLALSIAAFTAVPANHVMGQANFPGLAFAILGLWAADRDRWALGGLLMGAACMVKMSPALFLGWWLMKGRWKPAVVACLTAVGLTLAVLPLLDLERQLVFYTRVLPAFGSGDYNGLSVPIGMFGNHSVPNLWHQLFWQPGDTLSTTAQTLSSLSAIALLGGLFYRFRRPGDPLVEASQVAAIGIALLLVPVYTYEHHCVWAIPAVVVSFLALLQGRLHPLWAAPLGVAFGFWSVEILDLKGASITASRAVPFVGWLVQEAKFVALLIFGAAATWVGGHGYDAQPGRTDGE